MSAAVTTRLLPGTGAPRATRESRAFDLKALKALEALHSAGGPGEPEPMGSCAQHVIKEGRPNSAEPNFQSA